MSSFQFEAIGTQWQIEFYNQLSREKKEKLKKKIFKRIEEFDLTYSRFKENSWVSKQAYKKTTSPIPQDFKELFELYKKLYQLSDGLFTPLIGSVLEQAGYDKSYSLKAGKLTSPPPLEEAIVVKDDEITFRKDVLLDFGAAGKGYLVDLVSEILEIENVKDYCVDASGDILFKTTKTDPLRIGLEHPDDPTLAIGVCELLNKSICGSAGNRRKWGQFHHTINPFTLTSPEEIKAVWVVADTTMLSDALATCLYLEPTPERYRDFKFEYVLMYKDNSAQISKGFPGKLF